MQRLQRAIWPIVRQASHCQAPRTAAGCWSACPDPLGGCWAPVSFSTAAEVHRDGGTAAPAAEPKALFTFNIEGRRWNGPLLVGMLDYFERHYASVGFFQAVSGEPFPRCTSGLPRHVELLYRAFGMRGDPQAMIGTRRHQLVELLARGQEGEVFDRVFDRFQAYRQGHELVVVEGTHEDGPVGVPGDRLELNAKLAAALSVPVLMSLDARAGRSVTDMAQSAAIAANACREEHADVLGLVVNRLPPDSAEDTLAELRQQLEPAGIVCFGGLPEDSLLASARLDAIASGLGAQLVAGQHDLLDASADEAIVAAGGLADTLRQMEGAPGRPLVIAPAARPDVVLALGAVQAAGGGPHPAGILVTDASSLDSRVARALQSGDLFRSPVLLAEEPLVQVLRGIDRLRASDMLPSSSAKIQRSKELFGRCVDGEALAAKLQAPSPAKRMTPKAFLHNLQRRVADAPQRIVLPEGAEPRVLRAAEEIARRQLARVILLGSPEAIQGEADKLGVDISGCDVVDLEASERLPAYIDLLCEARKHKGTTRDMAADMLQDPNYFGTMAVAAGDADGMVSGAVHTTAATIRPGLQVLRAGGIVSSVFFMCLADRVLVYGDCAVNVTPSASELAQIAAQSADSAAAFGVTPPRVAMLSYSTGTSGSGEQVEKVKEAVALLREQRPELLVEGPIQYDAAVDPEVARVKIKGASEVAGRANVLIFPDLNTGNNTYKAVQQSTGALAIGPIMQGLRKPVNDLSRGCTVPDIVNTVTCTAVQALAVQEWERRP